MKSTRGIILLTAAVIFLFGCSTQKNTAVIVPGSGAEIVKEEQTQEMQKENEEENNPLWIETSDIIVPPLPENRIVSEWKRNDDDPAWYERQLWTKEQVLQYYGWDLIPDDLPKGVSPPDGYEENFTVLVGRENTPVQGKLGEDTMGVSFYHLYDESCADKTAPEALRGFTLLGSRLGLLDRLDYAQYPPAEPSMIGGYPVTIWQGSRQYGKDGPVYETYVVHFDFLGAQYQLTTQQLSLEQTLRLAGAILTGQAPAIRPSPEPAG